MNSKKKKFIILLLSNAFSGIGCTILTLVVNSNKDTVIQVNDYSGIVEQNESLKDELARLKQDYNDLETINKEMKSQNSEHVEIENVPYIEYKPLSLTIDGVYTPIDENKSMVEIDGNEYFSKELVEKLLPDNKSLNIQDNTMYIGIIMKESDFLYNKSVVDKYCAEVYKNSNSSIEDSYGYKYHNFLNIQGEGSYLVFNLENQYSYMKCNIAVTNNRNSKLKVTIKADDKVVYDSQYMDLYTKVYEKSDIPIYNCSLLKIETHYDTSDTQLRCIISDAVVYN